MTEFSPDPAAIEASTGASLIAAPTDDGVRRRMPAYARRAAYALASRVGATVLLFDRSRESWTVIPPGRGPLDRAAVESLGSDYDYLLEQIDEGAAEGVEVRVWLTAEPPFQGLDEVIRKYPEIDVVVAPERPVKLSLGDRLRYVLHRGDIHAHVRKLVAPRPVLVAHEDGRIDVSTGLRRPS